MFDDAHPTPPQTRPVSSNAAGRPAPRLSRTAIAALVLGVISLLLGPVGLIAVPLGLAGLSATGKPAVRGRKLAVAAIITGMVGILITVVGSCLFVYDLHRTRPDREMAKAYVRALADNRLADALAMRDPTAMSSLENEGIEADIIRQRGPVTNITAVTAAPDRAAVANSEGRPVIRVTLAVTQGGTDYVRTVRIVNNPDGSHRVWD